AAALRKRARVLWAALAVVVIAALVAAVGFLQANHQRGQAQQRFREATGLRLAAEASAMLAHIKPGGDIRALQQMLAARAIGGSPVDGALFDAQVDRSTTRRIIDAGAPVVSMAARPEHHLVAAADGDGTVRMWDTATGRPRGDPLKGDDKL